MSGFLIKLIWKTQYYYFLYKPTGKGKNPFMELSRYIDQKREESPKMEKSRDIVRKSVWKQQFLAPESIIIFHCQKLFTFFSNQRAIFSAHGLQLYCFLGQVNLYCLCGLWKMSRQIWWFFKVRKFLQLLACQIYGVQAERQKRLSSGPKSHYERSRLRNQLVIAVENFGGEENLSPVLIPTVSEDMDEELKLAHNMTDIVDQANRKICVTLLRYNAEKPESSYSQTQLFAKKEEEKEIQKHVYAKFRLEKRTYLLDVMNPEYDENITNKPICNVH